VFYPNDFLKYMKVQKILGGLVIALFSAGAVFGQQLALKRNGRVVRVMENKRVLYRVALRGKTNMKGRKYDEAFLAGSCLIVRRNVRELDTGTESYPEVSRLEIYQKNGNRKIYHESRDLAISRLSDWELMNSPDFSWAIIADSGEAMFDGYFYISPQCEIRAVSFSPNGWFDWGDKTDGVFIDAATLKFSSMLLRNDGQEKRADIFIMKDGNFRIEIVGK
jgi:hypothetical protein